MEVSLSFNVAAATVERLKDVGLFESSENKVPQRFILCWDGKKQKLELVEFNLKKVIALLEGKGLPIKKLFHHEGASMSAPTG